MAAVEEENEDLKGVLPRAYTRLDNAFLSNCSACLVP